LIFFFRSSVVRLARRVRVPHKSYLILGWMTPMVELVGHQDQWAPKGPLGRTLKRTF
jgi:hypothetical protein